MQAENLAQAANLIWGFDPKVIATAIVVVCYIILFTEKLNRAASINVSFADMLQKKYNIYMIKDAIDGTTLVDVDNNSYISRMKKYTASDNIDLLVVQLSTNDSYKNFPIRGGRTALKMQYL